MDVAMVGGRAVVGSFTTGPVLAKAPSLERLARRNLGVVVDHLLGRVVQAERLGKVREVEAILAEAERLSRLVTA